MEEDLRVLRTQRSVNEDIPDYLNFFVIELAVIRHCAELVERILNYFDHFFMLAIELKYMSGYVLRLQFQSSNLSSYFPNILSRVA